MLKFILVEDNDIHRKNVNNIIVKYMMSNNIDYQIKEFNDETSSLNNLIKEKQSNHIYILDYELPHATALDIARTIRETDWISPIIILSAHGGFAFESFKKRLQILDFVCKQFETEKNLIELFDICLNQLNLKDYLNFKYKNTNYIIPCNKILYIYRDTVERKTIIVTEKEEYQSLFSIKDIFKMLPKYFKVSHRACIINTKRVVAYNWRENIVIFDNKKESYLISKTHRKELEQN